jgi:hypothetical protein
MGKSCTTTQVAWNTKLADPTSWVVRINWKDHIKELQKMSSATFNFDSLVEFLCSAAFPESKYSDIERSMLKQALEDSGNVTVLMDGFDEISPIHVHKAAVILCELMETNVERVWVTSRPMEKERLEMKLCVIAWNIKKLSRKSQEELLLSHWISKACGEKEKLVVFINEILNMLNVSVKDRSFPVSPLHIIIIATAFELEIEKHMQSKDSFLPTKPDTLDLCERFVHMQVDIEVEEEKPGNTKPKYLDKHEDVKEMCFKNFEGCALAAILPPSLLKSLHNKNIEDEIQPFLKKVQAEEDKTYHDEHGGRQAPVRTSNLR